MGFAMSGIILIGSKIYRVNQVGYLRIPLPSSTSNRNIKNKLNTDNETKILTLDHRVYSMHVSNCWGKAYSWERGGGVAEF